jgi:hypothetical protein
LPGWTWNARSDRWDEGFSRLIDYVGTHGNARVPLSYAVNGFPLGQWVNLQRDNRVKHALALDADRQHRLEAVPGWTWDPLVDQWDEAFARLLNYAEQHGDARVPGAHTDDDDYKLGAWVSRQRSQRSNGTLDADRQHRLEGVPGWSWDAADYDGAWEDGMRRLGEYIELRGDSLVPQSYVADGYPLGSWVTVQRHKYAKGTLDPERRRRLDNLPGWSWDARTAQWEAGFRRLLQYVESHGDAVVPQACTVDGFKLGKWVNTQRVFQAKGRLHADRERRLGELPGWVWRTRSSRKPSG